jgi:hypothetical protein
VELWEYFLAPRFRGNDTCGGSSKNPHCFFIRLKCYAVLFLAAAVFPDAKHLFQYIGFQLGLSTPEKILTLGTPPLKEERLRYQGQLLRQ